MTYSVDVYEVTPNSLSQTWGYNLNFRAANDLFDRIVDSLDLNLTDDVALVDEDDNPIKFYNFETGNIIYSDEFYELIK